MSKGQIIANIFANNKYLSKVFVFAISLVAGIIFGSTFDVIKNASAESYIDTAPASILSETTKSYDEKSSINKVEIASIQMENEYTKPKFTTGAGILYMPSIGLYTGVSAATTSGNTINVPSAGVGAYKNLLVSHNTSSFSGLINVYNDFVSGKTTTFNYNGRDYTVTGAEIADLDLSDGRYIWTNNHTTRTDMNKIMSKSSLVMMTCYGKSVNVPGIGATLDKRIFIYAN
ncbi:hypothetical protein IJG79_02185 [Candidatus Saccharibacteria bacterium]|nr:hypothetical protein [Candidatus Saccharibacteria bacterium]